MAAGVPTSDVLAFLRANKGLPQSVQPGGPAPAYGDLSGITVAHQGQPSDQECSDLGILRTLTNPTPGTAVAYSFAAGGSSFQNTTAAFGFFNGSKVGKRFSLRRLKLLLTVAPTATVSLEMATRIDDGSLASLVPSAGFTSAQMLNPNMDDQTQSDVTCFSFSAGAMTIPAPTARSRFVDRGRIATGLGIIGDGYEFQFGGDNTPTKSPLAVARATDPANLGCVMLPATIGPGQWLFLYLWWLTAATTAPSFEWAVSGYEKP